MARRASAPRGSGRPRDDALTRAILAAMLDLVARHGFRDARIEDAAVRVGTSKQAIYRRWPDKSVLVAEAVRAALAGANPAVPDSGRLRDDLVALLSNTIGALTKTPLGGALAALVGETRDAALVACLRDVERDRRETIRAVLKQGQRRGELSAGRDIEIDIDLLLGAVYFRLLVRRVGVSASLATKIVAAWLPREAAP